ncbi:MAG: transglycosylase SLT domain-containing protein [bacterium]|nr:transglycosylase SLT domain-containing protein [bacterium]
MSSFRSYLRFLESSPVDADDSCLEGTPVLSEIVEPEAVLQWAPTVCAVFDPVDASTALCIISYESGGDPDSTNRDDPGRGSFGLMQINSDWWIGSAYHERMVGWFGHDDETYLDPAVNIGAAALLVNDPSLTGWHAWPSSRLCPHRHHEHTL